MAPQRRLPLRVDELHAETVRVVAHDAGARLAKRHFRANLWACRRADGGTRQRTVQHPAGRLDALGELERLHGVARRGNARVTACFRPAEFGAVGEPGELVCKLVALVLRGLQLDGETTVVHARHRALDAADVTEVGGDALARAHGQGGHRL